MGKWPKIRCYDYINHPYERVRTALKRDPLAVFRAATTAAASRARTVASELRVDLGGVGLEAGINIAIKKIEEKPSKGMTPPATRLKLEWESTTMPGLFPRMKADLSVYPLTATETQLDFSGAYKPPLGPLGKAVNAIVGHRIAEASVHRFVGDVADYLRRSLA